MAHFDWLIKRYHVCLVYSMIRHVLPRIGEHSVGIQIHSNSWPYFWKSLFTMVELLNDFGWTSISLLTFWDWKYRRNKTYLQRNTHKLCLALKTEYWKIRSWQPVIVFFPGMLLCVWTSEHCIHNYIDNNK